MRDPHRLVSVFIFVSELDLGEVNMIRFANLGNSCLFCAPKLFGKVDEFFLAMPSFPH